MMSFIIFNLKKLLKKNKYIFFIALKTIYFFRIIVGLNSRRSLIHRINKKFILNKELKILKLSKAKRIYIVYDCNVSPFTLGDFFNVAMGARYFQMKGYEISFHLIKYDLNKKYLKNNSNFINNFYSEFEKILSSLLKKKFTYKKESWIKFKKRNFDCDLLLFKSRVLKRKYTYGFYFNLMNTLCLKESSLFLKKYLLNKKNLKFSKKFKIPNKKYITIHCRFNRRQINKKDNRNLKSSEFIKVIRLLKRKFKNYDLLIISDKIGCNYFYKISKKNNFKVQFSKNYTNSFMDDGVLVLNSSYYFQLWSGGICVFTYYSQIPFLRCTTYLQNEIPYKKNQLSIWHKKENFLIQNDNRNYKEFLKKIEDIKIK